MNKLIALLVVILLILLACAWLFSSTPEVTSLSPEQMKMQVDWAYQSHLRWQVVWWGITVGVILSVVGGGLYVQALAYKKRVLIYVDPITGMYPISHEDRASLWDKLRGIHDWITRDFNLNAAPTVRTHANGTVKIESDLHGVPLEAQMKYADRSWDVQRSIAANQPGVKMTQAAYKALAGVYDNEARERAAKAQVAENRLTPPSHQIVDAKPTQEPYQLLTPEQALVQSVDGVAYIGQQDFDVQACATWNANAASTLGVFGANGTGKTSSVAEMVTLAMIKWGWQLYILDGKDAGDWDGFSNHAVVTPVDGGNIEQVIETIWKEYQQRKALMTEHRARKYAELPAPIRAQYPQWGMVFEEYGATRLRLKARQKAALDKFTGILCSEARYTGWHGVFIDQRPTDYTDEMKGNLKAIACFQLKMNQGHAVNCYQAGNLAARGEFEMDGERYKAFHAEPLVRSALAQLPPRFGGSLAVRSFNEPNHPPVDEPSSYEPPPGSVHEPMNRNEPDTWERIAFEFLTSNPMARSIDLAEHMAAINGKAKKDMKSTAHAYYQKFQEQQLKQEAPQTGAEQLAAMGLHISQVDVVGRKVR